MLVCSRQNAAVCSCSSPLSSSHSNQTNSNFFCWFRKCGKYPLVFTQPSSTAVVHFRSEFQKLKQGWTELIFIVFWSITFSNQRHISARHRNSNWRQPTFSIAWLFSRILKVWKRSIHSRYAHYYFTRLNPKRMGTKLMGLLHTSGYLEQPSCYKNCTRNCIRNKTFLFVRIETWNFQNLFD